MMKKNEKRLKYLIWSKDKLTPTFCSLQQQIDFKLFSIVERLFTNFVIEFQIDKLRLVYLSIILQLEMK